MSFPRKYRRPFLGRRDPTIDLNSVDLPAPLAPTSATASPALSAIDTSRSAETWPYATDKLSMFNSALMTTAQARARPRRLRARDRPRSRRALGARLPAILRRSPCRGQDRSSAPRALQEILDCARRPAP